MHVGAVGLVVSTLGLAGCKSSSDRTTGQKFSDRQVARGVKKELSSDPTFKYSDVEATVYNGNVQLSGFVETPEQRLRVAELASYTKGVRQVINEIMLKPTPTGPATIRDPLGNETGRLMVDTNSRPAHLRNLPDNTPQQQPEHNAGSTGANPQNQQ